jgi:hypothetical protein
LRALHRVTEPRGCGLGTEAPNMPRPLWPQVHCGMQADDGVGEEPMRNGDHLCRLAEDDVGAVAAVGVLRAARLVVRAGRLARCAEQLMRCGQAAGALLAPPLWVSDQQLSAQAGSLSLWCGLRSWGRLAERCGCGELWCDGPL